MKVNAPFSRFCLQALAMFSLALLLVACNTPTDTTVDDNTTDSTTDGETQSFTSSGGTSELTLTEGEGGTRIASFDPGAFVEIAEAETTSIAQDGGNVIPPPPDSGGGDGGDMPPPNGSDPTDPNMPPPDGSDPTDPNMPPPDGNDPTDPNMPPPDGNDPTDPNMPPPDGNDPTDPNMPPPDGDMPPPDGGMEPISSEDPVFCDGTNCPLPPPPDGGLDVIVHCEGDCGKHFGHDLTPDNDEFLGDFYDRCPDCPPLPPDFFEPKPEDGMVQDEFFGDRPDWYMEPPRDGGGDLPAGFFFNQELDEFISDGRVKPGDQIDFKDIPFDRFFAEGGNLQGLLPQLPLPPRVDLHVFGEFEQGKFAPDGFPEPPHGGVDGVLNVDDLFGNADDRPEPGHFELHDLRPELLDDADGTDVRDLLGPLLASEAAIKDFQEQPPIYDEVLSRLAEALKGPRLDDIIDELPDDHPARDIGDGLSDVQEFFPELDELNSNPELEQEKDENHHPTPDGFDGFTFEGSCPQFYDMFLTFNDDHTGEEQSAQIHTQFSMNDEMGRTFDCKESTELMYTNHEGSVLIQDDTAPADEERWVSFHGGQTLATRKFVCINADDPEDQFEGEESCLGYADVQVQLEPQEDAGMAVGGRMQHTTTECSTTGTPINAPPLIRDFNFGSVLNPENPPTTDPTDPQTPVDPQDPTPDPETETGVEDQI
jgi:hypothetical protein